MVDADFGGKVAVVTGGTGALGGAVVDALLERGAEVRIPSLNESETRRCRRGGHDRVKIATGVDLTDEGQVAGYYRSVGEVYASFHVAGGFGMSAIGETSLADLEKQWGMNLVTCYLCCREAARLMTDAGGGRIVNVGARPAVRPEQGSGMTAYAVSKAGVAALTGALAEEVKGSGVLVNAVLPSIMDTEANREAMPEADHDSWAKVEEVARVMVGLGSPGNTVTSGALVPVYGRS